MPTKKPTIGKLVWSTKHRTYFRGTHKLTPAEMSDVVNAVASNAAQQVDTLSRKLIAGTINTAQWAKGMQEAVQRGHRAMALLAYGGQPHITEPVWAQTAAIIKQQDKYLKRFVEQVRNGQAPLTDGLVNRARMYMDALYATHENLALMREEGAGATEARRVLAGGAVDDRNCEPCIELARKGWLPIDKLPRLGATPCLSKCRCRFETRTVKE